MKSYIQSCKSEFWQKVFKAETDYILDFIKDCKEILSVGCGPAHIEAKLAEYGFSVTGLDVSKEALDQAPDTLRTVAGSAEKTGFDDGSFDAVLYTASLQFIEKYPQAIAETARILRPNGKLLVMLLNTKSKFFREKIKDPDSYVNRIRHTNQKEIEEVIRRYFLVETEYFLGIQNAEVYPSREQTQAGLYIIKGIKKQPE